MCLSCTCCVDTECDVPVVIDRSPDVDISDDDEYSSNDDMSDSEPIPGDDDRRTWSRKFMQGLNRPAFSRGVCVSARISVNVYLYFLLVLFSISLYFVQ